MTYTMRWLPVLALLSVAGCAPEFDRLKPTLGASDSGTVWFVTDERDVLPGWGDRARWTLMMAASVRMAESR